MPSHHPNRGHYCTKSDKSSLPKTAGNFSTHWNLNDCSLQAFEIAQQMSHVGRLGLKLGHGQRLSAGDLLDQ